MKLTSEKDNDLDLERIMEDSDTLLDIVNNRPVTQANNGNISDGETPVNCNVTPTITEPCVTETELFGVTRNTDGNREFHGVTDKYRQG